MKINLKKTSQQSQPSSVSLTLEERLPPFLAESCVATCDYSVISHDDFDLLITEVHTDLKVVCQRCLEVFEHTYRRRSELAVCRDDTKASHHMASYDSVVSDQGEVDLVEIITDELHLYCPEKHEETFCHLHDR